MHSLKDLKLLLASLKEDAAESGFELVTEATNEENLFVLANMKNSKALVIGLTKINDTKLIVSYSISLNKWQYYKNEGFNSSQMSECPIRDEIFNFVAADEIINYLKN